MSVILSEEVVREANKRGVQGPLLPAMFTLRLNPSRAQPVSQLQNALKLLPVITPDRHFNCIV